MPNVANTVRGTAEMSPIFQTWQALAGRMAAATAIVATALSASTVLAQQDDDARAILKAMSA
jgi:hypothetical protein